MAVTTGVTLPAGTVAAITSPPARRTSSHLPRHPGRQAHIVCLILESDSAARVGHDLPKARELTQLFLNVAGARGIDDLHKLRRICTRRRSQPCPCVVLAAASSHCRRGFRTMSISEYFQRSSV